MYFKYGQRSLRWHWGVMGLRLADERNIETRLQDVIVAARNSWGRTEQLTYQNARDLEEALAGAGRRIQEALSPHDPGTAGDVAENRWADAMRRIFPGLSIVVKGTISGSSSGPSPQIDILIVDKACPTDYLDFKSIPLPFVKAAFECKLNLRLADVRKSLDTAARIKAEAQKGGGRAPYFGVLALGSAIASTAPMESVLDLLSKHRTPDHGLHVIDAILVANQFCLLATPEINCWDFDNHPLTMTFEDKYHTVALGRPDPKPADSPLGTFQFGLAHWLERRDESLAGLREVSQIFLSYGLDEVTITSTRLETFLPLETIQDIAAKIPIKGLEDVEISL